MKILNILFYNIDICVQKIFMVFAQRLVKFAIEGAASSKERRLFKMYNLISLFLLIPAVIILFLV